MNTGNQDSTDRSTTPSPLPTPSSPLTAVVFAYHNVGARCLRVMLAHGVKISLVVTHEDNPEELIWFESVAELARNYGIPVIAPADPNTEEFASQLRVLQPDFLFSFYYRLMLKPAILEIPRCGAYNMHGSLLPKYRGRVPVNWAIIHGEHETGATLHRMVEKPDAGEIIAQQSVPILPDDTAGEVFGKVTLAAEMALYLVLPDLLAGTVKHHVQDVRSGSYFGGRKPEDGRIDWNRPATDVHNLIRAVAPPYPGAFCDINGRRLVVKRSLGVPHCLEQAGKPQLKVVEGALFARCGDGRLVKILSAMLDGKEIVPIELPEKLGANPIPLN